MCLTLFVCLCVACMARESDYLMENNNRRSLDLNLPFFFFFFKPPTFILLVVYKVTDCRESLKLRVTLVWSLLINSRSNFSSPKLLFIHQHLWCSTVVLLAHYCFFRYISCFLVIKPSYSLHHISHSQYINSWFIAYTNFVNQNRNRSKFWERSSKLPPVKLL